jgi:hypothetical protein
VVARQGPGDLGPCVAGQVIDLAAAWFVGISCGSWLSRRKAIARAVSKAEARALASSRATGGQVVVMSDDFARRFAGANHDDLAGHHVTSGPVFDPLADRRGSAIDGMARGRFGRPALDPVRRMGARRARDRERQDDVDDLWGG